MIKEKSAEVINALDGLELGTLEMVYARPEPDKGLVYCTLRQVLPEATDDEMRSAVRKVFDANPDRLVQLRNKPQLMGWFVGQTMKELKGAADPRRVNDLCLEHFHS